MTLSINPFDFDALYDQIVLDGVASPGNVTLSGHARDEKWDVKEADGEGGASTTAKGEQLSKFTATFALVYDPTARVNDFADWDSFLPTLRSCTANPDAPRALDIYHPDLVELGITTVVVTRIGGKVHDGKGGASVSVDFLEYRPPRPKGGAPKPGGKKKSGPDPNEDVKKEIDALVKEAQKP